MVSPLSPRLGANRLRYLVIVFDSPVHEPVNLSSPQDLDHKTQNLRTKAGIN